MDIHARIRIAAVVPASGRITQQVRNSDALLKRTRPTAFINTAARATHSRRKKSVLYARPPRPCRAARGGGLFFLTVLFSLHMLTESLWNALALCAALVALLIWIKKSSTTPSRAALKIYSFFLPDVFQSVASLARPLTFIVFRPNSHDEYWFTADPLLELCGRAGSCGFARKRELWMDLHVCECVSESCARTPPREHSLQRGKRQICNLAECFHTFVIGFPIVGVAFHHFLYNANAKVNTEFEANGFRCVVRKT